MVRQPDLSTSWREQLARLFPELGTPRAAVEEEEHVRLFEAMAHAVGYLAMRQPLLLVLEDLHWADDMSLRLLAFLSRRGAAWPVLLVATVRTEEMVDAPAVTRLLRELSSDRHFESLTLAPLSAPHTVTLVRLLARVGTDELAVQRLGTQIWRASEGNPFMVVETMRSLYGTDAAEISDQLPTPPRVRDIITARLDRLSQRGRDLVALASVIAPEFDFALLESAAGADGAQTATTVEELVAHRVLHVPAIRAFAVEHAAMPAFRSGLALLCCHLGRLAEARTIFDELAAQGFDQFPRDATWINGMDELAQVCAALGDRQRAALLYERLAPYEHHNVVIAFAEACEGSVARYLGLLAATLARWGRAGRLRYDTSTPRLP